MSIAPPNPPAIWARDENVGGPQDDPTLIVMHATVSSDNAGTARNIAQRWHDEVTQTSAHYLRDAKECIQAVGDHRVAYHCGYNIRSVAYEMCDEQTGPASRWTDADSTAIIEGSARDVARLGLAYGIPLRRLTNDQLRYWAANGKQAKHGGIVSHEQMSVVFRKSTHTDPRDFPWTTFMAKVEKEADALLAPTVTSHTRWALRTTGVYATPGGTKLRDLAAGDTFGVIDGSGYGNDGWIETTHHNWVRGADTTRTAFDVLTWNVENTGDADAVLDRAEIVSLLADHRPRFACFQEVYRVDLSDIPGYQTYQAFEGYTADSENRAQAILVRDDVALKIKQAIPMEEAWTGPKMGIEKDPRVHRYVVGNEYDLNIPVATFHVPFGSEAVEETRAAAISWLELMEQSHGRGVIVGDWNSLADLLQAKVGDPAGATADGGGLDRAVFVGLTKIKGENLGNRGRSDHPVKKWLFAA